MAKNRPSEEQTAEIVAVTQFNDEELRSIESFEDATRLAASYAGGIESVADALGNGFALLANEDKDQLIGVSLILVGWKFNLGDFGKFVSITAVAKPKGGGIRKVIFNDGSSGVMEQLADYSTRTGKLGGLFVPKGLRRSDYEFEDQNGDMKPASTYYLDLSA